MTRKDKDDISEILWTGLVGLPALAAFVIGFHLSHSAGTAGIIAGVIAGIGIGILLLRRISADEKLKRSGTHDIDKMSGRQFEYYLGHLFRTQGYKVQVTRESGDFGADLIIQKDGKIIAVQAKRKKGSVGIDAVQEVQASIAHYKAHEAWVVTNSRYTEAAKSLARSNRVRLVDRNTLVEMINKVNPKGLPSSPASIDR
ncbi:restriction endonuclease [Alicyclobacillus cycloheptanicus]|uniref:Restriction system protein n=1 Tax=Alicyclobacillus cycloheptanicus TaxID=1457 RepID=A0ABT9XMT5_9BACL|nr:restriction endonuclease [Alicyclobacillus cycloheptanicus]MDQ0191595.1 restriction system protein [Alicyclobacillus cycloheptanicus]WDM02241.1 restriction endonuclease [Alicyclobacillus cycloheptanicus]